MEAGSSKRLPPLFQIFVPLGAIPRAGNTLRKKTLRHFLAFQTNYIAKA
jgi:hypothetical protein